MEIWKLWIALLCVALVMRDWCMVRATAILVANWAMLHFYFTATGDQFNWLVNFSVDYAAASLMLVNCSGRLQIPAISVFVPMLVAHLAFAWSSQNPWATYNYYFALLYMALTQAALLGLAIGYGGMEALRNRYSLSRHAPSGIDLAARVGDPKAGR